MAWALLTKVLDAFSRTMSLIVREYEFASNLPPLAIHEDPTGQWYSKICGMNCEWVALVQYILIAKLLPINKKKGPWASLAQFGIRRLSSHDTWKNHYHSSPSRARATFWNLALALVLSACLWPVYYPVRISYWLTNRIGWSFYNIMSKPTVRLQQ